MHACDAIASLCGLLRPRLGHCELPGPELQRWQAPLGHGECALLFFHRGDLLRFRAWLVRLHATANRAMLDSSDLSTSLPRGDGPSGACLRIPPRSTNWHGLDSRRLASTTRCEAEWVFICGDRSIGKTQASGAVLA
ncbi:unnamed protein product [Diplocarpon coronariae]